MKQNSLLKRVRESRLLWPLVAWVIILIFDAIVEPGFFRLGIIADPVYGKHLYGNLVDIFNNGAPLMLVAIGMTLVLADLAAGTLCGLWNGILVSRARIQPMVATLILMVAGRGIAQLITNGQIMTIYYTPYFWFGNGYILGLPVSIYIVALVFLLAWVLIRKTAIGLFIESVGINAKSTFYSGINEQNVKLLAYTFCGFCGAIAGLILSSYVHSADGNNNGLNYELDAILSVVLGGTLMAGGRFSLLASIIGALVIWTFTLSMYTFGVPANALLAGRAVLVLIVILLYSDQSRRMLNRLFEWKEPRHGTTN